MSHSAKAIVITCMDFRLLDHARNYLIKKGYEHAYDHFVLAGVSLGFLQNHNVCWGHSLIDHIKMSQKLHDTKEVILIDHMDCGAYKTLINGLKPEREREEHIKNLNKAVEELKKIIPNTIFYKWILSLNGNVEEIK